MTKKLKKAIASLIAITSLSTCAMGITANAYTVDDNSSAVVLNLDLNNSRASGSFPFNVTSKTNYGKFTATKSTITASFNNCSTGSALVKIHKSGYTGTVVGNFIVPSGSGIPTQYVNISVSSGTTYYITVEPYGGYIQAIGSFSLNY